MEDKGDSEQRFKSAKGTAFNLKKFGAPAFRLLAIFLVLALVILPYLPQRNNYQVGRPSPRTVFSAKSFMVEDREKTSLLREKEQERVRSWYIDPTLQRKALTDLRNFFRQLDVWASEQVPAAELSSRVEEAFGIELAEADLQAYLGMGEDQREIVKDRAEEIVIAIMYDLIIPENIQEKRDMALDRAGELALDQASQRLVGAVASAHITRNTLYPTNLIDQDVKRAAQLVAPVYVEVAEGQKIVQKDEVITELQLRELELAGIFSISSSLRQVLGIVILLGLLLASLFFYLRRRQAKQRRTGQMQYFYISAILIFTLFARLFSSLAEINVVWGFLIPLPFISMLFVLMVDRELALVMVVVGTVVTGLLLKGNYYLTLATLVNGILAMFFSLRAARREELLREGLLISGTIGVVCFAIALIFKDIQTAFWAFVAGVGNGALSSILTMGLFTLMEKISGITTNIKLLELASTEHPLLHELVQSAPGTYTHSLMVGNLANAAARAIGADPLLARVGAYYHDVGKLKRPSFFAENMPQGGKGHERINPNLSALVIAAHVKEGVELAKQFRLPQEIVDIIRQHHGTSIIKYFYARAMERPGKEGKVAEDRFRYPGEKPQSKEAAIVLLADAIEAATRALPNSSPVKLEQVIQNVIEERLHDGQLDNCDLSLSELSKINRAFLQIIIGTQHQRVEYPNIAVGGRKWRC
jgi:hypothetical protein